MNSSGHVYEDIPAYLAGELTEEERRTVELHIRECKTCNQELGNQKKLDEILSKAKSISPQPQFVDRVMKAATPRPADSRKRNILPWLAVAAVIAVILFLLKIQRDTSVPAEQVKKSPVVKPEVRPEPKLNLPPVQPEPESEPQITKKEKKIPERLPEPVKEDKIPALTPEEVEVVANLDELEDMELISNYENLENLELALIGEGNESLK
jgi:anti-sigma factor RsiW